MEESFLRKHAVLVIFGIAGAMLFAFLYDKVSPKASVDLKYRRNEVMHMSRAFLETLGYDVQDYQQDAWFEFDGNAHIYLQTLGGVEKANEMIRADTISTHSWQVTWYHRDVSRSQELESYSVYMSPGGKVLGFDHVIKDSTTKRSISTEDGQALARDFLLKQHVNLDSYFLKTSSDTKLVGRVDHRFVWAQKDPAVDATIWVRVQGDEVGGFRINFSPAGEFQREFTQKGTAFTFLLSISFAALFLLFFYIVILFLRKYHEGEVGTKTAVMVFVGLFVVSALATINEYSVIGAGTGIGDLNRFNVRIIVFITTVFIFQAFMSVMVFAGWSVGESSSRSIWSQKLAAVDSFLFRRFFTIDLAEGIVRGYAWGLILLGGYAAILYFLIHYLSWGVFVLSVSGIPESYVTPLQPILHGISAAAFAEIVYRLFFVSYLHEKLKRSWAAVLISTAIWTATVFVIWDIPFGYIGIIGTLTTLFVFGLVLSLLFRKYDLATTVTANFVLITLNAAIPLFSSTGADFLVSRWVVLALLALPLVLAIGGFVKRQRFEFTPEIMPAHIQRISERVRMAKELEIARKVQMSLLPKVNPIVQGYDIAGLCIPALEVGGDYYDFVNLGGRKLGIAIGDVSGKGVPAAIYMTLTKGILQSHAEDNVSPKHVLSKVNSLMYRTIERNSFVSMFYAILDTEKKTIRFSRAGQCPVIVAQRSGEQGSFLTPKGIALGLEMGKVFDAVLEEQEMQTLPGDVLVFYTDGFTEAMNSEEKEFGESKLVESIARHRHKPADGIIQGICGEVADFIGGTPQHDDMTIVVVKVDAS